MIQIRKSETYTLLGGVMGQYNIYCIESNEFGKRSAFFTREVVNSLCSMDLDIFDHECSELMKIENFHIENEFKQIE